MDNSRTRADQSVERAYPRLKFESNENQAFKSTGGSLGKLAFPLLLPANTKSFKGANYENADLYYS
jgi:hypothetical protein